MYNLRFNSTLTVHGIPKFGSRKPKALKIAQMSMFLPAKVIDILRKLPRTHYVGCVKYKGGDWQIGITGSLLPGESPLNGAAREVAEEMRLANLKFVQVDEVKFPGFVNTYFSASLRDASLISRHENADDIKHPDGIKRKITAIISGTKDEWRGVVGGMSRGDGQLNDDIVALGYMSVADAINCADIIKARGKNRDAFWYSFETHSECRAPVDDDVVEFLGFKTAIPVKYTPGSWTLPF